MAELFDIVNAFTPPLKVAWVVWFAWGTGQVFWYRSERKPRVAKGRKPVAPSARKPFVSRPSSSDRVATRLVTPNVVTHLAEPIAQQPVAAAPVVDAVAQVAELDRFVADFEMNARHRRGEPHNGVPYNLHIGG